MADCNSDTFGSDSGTNKNHGTRFTQLATPASIPARLTRKNLARLNKLGRVSKKDKTGKDNEAAAARPSITDEDSIASSSSSSLSLSSEALSTTAPGFALQARNNGILDASVSRPPSNLTELRKRLAQPRDSTSPPESVYEEYAHAIKHADNEATVLFFMTPALLQTYSLSPYKTVVNQAWTAFPKDAGFNNGLSAPQPDFVQGLDMEAYRPLPVNRRVPGAVLYKDNTQSVALPHIAGEWKGPGGDMREAALQSSYDGAAMVYARNRALAYQGQGHSQNQAGDTPGHSEVSTFTTDGNQLTFYAHYAAPAVDDSIDDEVGDNAIDEAGAAPALFEYHQYPIQTTSLVNSHDEYKAGRRALRNLQDHARDQSYKLKDQLRAYYKQETRKASLGAAMPVPVPVPIPMPRPNVQDDDNLETTQAPVVGLDSSVLPAPSETNGRKRKASLSSPSQSSGSSSRHRTKLDSKSAGDKADHADNTIG